MKHHHQPSLSIFGYHWQEWTGQSWSMNSHYVPSLSLILNHQWTTMNYPKPSNKPHEQPGSTLNHLINLILKHQWTTMNYPKPWATIVNIHHSNYLGSFITPTSSSIPDVLYRCSQASTAYKQPEPFFRHSRISPKKKLQIYSQIVQAITLHGSESQVYSPQITRIDSLHIRHFARFSKLRVLPIIEFSILQMLTAPTNTF